MHMRVPDPPPPLCPPPSRFDPLPWLAAGIFLACAVATLGIGFLR